MAQNTVLNPGVGGDTLATDDNGSGVKNEVVKLAFGASGATPTTVTSSAGLPVNGSGVTQPISAASLPLPSGAATAAKQPALGTAGTASSDVISVQGIASMTKLLVTPDLPPGASTAAKQPALGTAGTPSADVITVQGVTSMTALKVDGSSVTQPVSFGLATSGGFALPTHFVTTGANNEKANVKASAGQLYRVRVFNGEAFPIFVKFHNTAGVPTPGSGVVLTIGVQGGTFYDAWDSFGTAFGTGIGVTVTKLVADADTTQVSTNSVVDIYTK